MTGTARAGASANAAPCRAVALRARRADAWRPSPLPVGRWWPAVTRRPAPASRGKQLRTGRSVEARVQQCTAKAGPERSQTGMSGRRPGTAEGNVAAGRKAYCLFRSSGQGRGRTADLPLFRRTLIPTELPDLAGHCPGHAVLTGFEPATSTLTGWRALLAALQDHVYRPPVRRAVPPTGFEPVLPP